MTRRGVVYDSRERRYDHSRPGVRASQVAALYSGRRCTAGAARCRHIDGRCTTRASRRTTLRGQVNELLRPVRDLSRVGVRASRAGARLARQGVRVHALVHLVAETWPSVVQVARYEPHPAVAASARRRATRGAPVHELFSRNPGWWYRDDTPALLTWLPKFAVGATGSTGRFAANSTKVSRQKVYQNEQSSA
jgi:hypothetical protein